MEGIKRFYIRALRRRYNGRDLTEMREIAMIQGLIYGLCAIPSGTSLWDCVWFPEHVLFPVDCTEEQGQKLKQEIEKLQPELYTIHKFEGFN